MSVGQKLCKDYRMHDVYASTAQGEYPNWVAIDMSFGQCSCQLLLLKAKQLVKGQKALMPQPEHAHAQLLGTSSSVLLPMLLTCQSCGMPLLVVWQNQSQTLAPVLPVQKPAARCAQPDQFSAQH